MTDYQKLIEEAQRVLTEGYIDRDEETIEPLDIIEDLIDALEDLLKYEYAWMADEQSRNTYPTREDAELIIGNPRQFRRRVAGPWEAVDA